MALALGATPLGPQDMYMPYITHCHAISITHTIHTSCIRTYTCTYMYILVIDEHGNLFSHLQFRGEWEVLWSKLLIRQALLINYKSIVPKFLAASHFVDHEKLWYNYNIHTYVRTYACMMYVCMCACAYVCRYACVAYVCVR